MDKNTKYLWVGLVIAMVCAIIGLFTPSGQKVVERVVQSNLGGMTNYDALTTTATSTFDNGFNSNGAGFRVVRQSVGTASTTCLFKNPMVATSSLTDIMFASTKATGTALRLYVATSSSGTSTSTATLLAMSNNPANLAASESAYISWRPNSSSTKSSNILEPNGFLVFWTEGGYNEQPILEGTCSAVIIRP